ncbi:MAG: tRNA pseudouridine(13) synthase TruD [Steroidobacter sp.]
MNILTDYLTLPCAHGGPAGKARIRAAPEDFLVREWLGFSADGEGDHLLLRVRKRGANTMWVAKQLARLGKLHPKDVGFAGLKDRDAVAEQSFTVPARSALAEQWAGVAGDGFEVLNAERHRRKLKRGALRGNEFEIVLRAFEGDAALLEQRLQAIRDSGVPNYFGPQRFGRAGHNLATALAWFAGETSTPERVERGFALSAARSAIFNAVVAERVRDRTWNRLRPGDLANLNGSGSIFAVETVDDVLNERCQRLDIHPTGPMVGGEPSIAAGEVATLEREIANRHAVLSDGLGRAGLESERRALRIAVDDLQWDVSANDVRLRFRLTRGAFATAVLHEVIDGVFATDVPDSGE